MLYRLSEWWSGNSITFHLPHTIKCLNSGFERKNLTYSKWAVSFLLWFYQQYLLCPSSVCSEVASNVQCAFGFLSVGCPRSSCAPNPCDVSNTAMSSLKSGNCMDYDIQGLIFIIALDIKRYFLRASFGPCPKFRFCINWMKLSLPSHIFL